MKKRKIILTTLIFALLFSSLALTVYAGFGSGIAVAATDTKIIKSAICGQKIVFSDLDFKQGLAIADFEKITVTSIPPSSEGTLLLAGRRVSVGTTIKRKNIGALVFVPASKDTSECKFSFKTDDFAEGAEVEFILRFTDKVNYAPEILSDADARIDTQRDISVYGRMEATDKEGDLIEYLVVSFPKVGVLKEYDSISGEYVYTPPVDFTGTDSFSYVARDEWGNFSKLCKVKIDVGERLSEVVYIDMTDHPNYNAAVALSAFGIMDGRIAGDGSYFSPDEKVTREEFVAMALKASGIKPNSSTSDSIFDDNASIDLPYLPYVKAAQRLGIVNGEFTGGALLFRPDDVITRSEAAHVIAKLTGASVKDTETVFSDTETVPVWARDEISALCSLGIIPCENNVLGGNVELTRADCAQYLYNMIRYLEEK